MERLTPYEYQEAGIQRMMVEPTKAALIASEMGQGKTLLACEFIARKGFEHVLIIGIKDTYDAWAERLEAQTDGRLLLRRIDATAPGKRAHADFLANVSGAYFSGVQYLAKQNFRLDQKFNPDGTPEMVVNKLTGQATDKPKKKKINLRTYAKVKGLQLVVMDEVHAIQNRVSNQARTLRSIDSEWKIGMSGTPYGNKFAGIWSVCRWLWPERIESSFVDWSAEWCLIEKVRARGGKEVENVTGEKDPGVFVAQLPCYIRDEADEKAPPAKIVYVDLTPEQRRDYSDLEEEGVVWLGEHPMVAALPPVLRSRLRTATLGVMSMTEDEVMYFDHNTISTKLNALRGILDYWGDQKVLIGCDSKRFVKVVVARMQAAGYSAIEWSGDVNTKGRVEVKRDFMDPNGSQYLVGTIPSMSTGIDGLQKAANKLIWLSQSESGIINEQFLARLFRPGRTLENGGFEHVILIARDTHDAGIYSKKLSAAIEMNRTLAFEAEGLVT